MKAPYELLKWVAENKKLPVVNCDAVLMMQLGLDGVFVGSSIFKSSDPVICKDPSGVITVAAVITISFLQVIYLS